MNSEHFEWLVKARGENQSQLLRLYRFSETNGKVLHDDPKKQDLFALLVGAALHLSKSGIDVNACASDVWDIVDQALDMMADGLDNCQKV